MLEVVTCRAELKNRHRRRRWAAGILEVEKRHLYHRHRWAAGILEVEKQLLYHRHRWAAGVPKAAMSQARTLEVAGELERLPAEPKVLE